MPEISRRVLTRQKTLDFLEGIAAVKEGISLYLPPLPPPSEIESYLADTAARPETPEITGLASGSRTGAVLFLLPGRLFLVLPPFPVTEKIVARKPETEPFVSSLRRDNTIALVLVRLGAYAVGVCRGEGLVSSKVGTGLVHGRHKKGGSSSARFRRHREKQIEYFMTRLCQHAREQLEPHVRTLDYIAYGGARTTILLAMKQCDFLGRLEIPELPPLLDIPEPRQAVLTSAVSRVWSSTVIEWRED